MKAKAYLAKTAAPKAKAAKKAQGNARGKVGKIIQSRGKVTK